MFQIGDRRKHNMPPIYIKQLIFAFIGHLRGPL